MFRTLIPLDKMLSMHFFFNRFFQGHFLPCYCTIFICHFYTTPIIIGMVAASRHPNNHLFLHREISNHAKNIFTRMMGILSWRLRFEMLNWKTLQVSEYITTHDRARTLILVAFIENVCACLMPAIILKLIFLISVFVLLLRFQSNLWYEMAPIIRLF